MDKTGRMDLGLLAELFNGNKIRGKYSRKSSVMNFREGVRLFLLPADAFRRHDELNDTGAFEPEGKVTGNRHFEEAETLQEWNSINPFRLAFEISHFPEETAQESDEG